MDGRIVNGVCVDATVASDIHYSLQPAIYIGGPSPTFSNYIKSGGNWYLAVSNINSDGTLTNLYWVNSGNTGNLRGVCDYQPAIVTTGLPADFDYTVLAALFAFSFSVVVGLWLFGKSAGSIVNIFKPK